MFLNVFHIQVLSGDVQLYGIQYVLILCAVSEGLSIPYQFLENRSKQSCTQSSGLRSWERAPTWTPFSDSLQRPYLNVIYSVMPLLLKILMLSGPLKIVICLALFSLDFFYCLKLPCIKIYKHAFLQIKCPCFTQDLGPLCPSSHRLQSPRPGLQRRWQSFLLAFLKFLLQDICFTILCWFLPYINMNQPQVYICLLPLEPPSQPPRHPTPLGCHRAPVSHREEDPHLLSISWN